jgi:hypothetical protein
MGVGEEPRTSRRGPSYAGYRACPRLKFTAEGTVEEGGEEVLGLAQRLPLHRTQAPHPLNQGGEFLLEGERRQRIGAWQFRLRSA